MFTVKPVRERELQEALAKVFGCEFFPDCYAFLAGNSEDGETLTSLLGFSQFVMNGDRDAVIKTVVPAPNYYDDTACSEEMAKKFGFRRVDDRWSIDLKKFYISPCHYNPDEK